MLSKKYGRGKQLRILAIGTVFILLPMAFSILFIFISNRGEKEARVVVPTLDKPLFTLNEQQAGSEVCERFSKNDVEGTIGISVKKINPSVPTTTTKEGQVSACTYELNLGEGAKKQSLFVISRTHKDAAEAEAVFKRMKTDSSVDLSAGGLIAYSSSNYTQIQVLKAERLTTINAVLSEPTEGIALKLAERTKAVL